MKYFVPRLVGQFCKAHPAIDVSLEILNRDSVVGRLWEHRDELYVTSMPPADMELEDHVFMENLLVVIAQKGSDLAGRRRVTVAFLKGERFILRERGSGTRIATDRHLAKMRFRPQVRLEFGSNEAIRQAVAGALGLGVLSVHALPGTSSRTGVVALDVQGFPIASHWHVVHPRNRKPSPVAAAFKSELIKVAGKVGSGR